MKKIKAALVGLGFGGAFAEIYKEHPDVSEIVIFDPNKKLEKEFCDAFGLKAPYNSFDEILNDDTVDAVHLVSPIPCHEEQTVKVLNAGKHCACTVPMATSLEGLRKIVEAKRKSGKNFMMMETSLYTYQFFYVKKMLESGEMGRIQFLRGSHYQDMEKWPDYWMGLPPMFYGTHAIAPMTVLAGARASKVNCFGSGTMREELVRRYGNPYPIETAVFQFDNGLKGEVTRSLFETARVYKEGMAVLGSKKSFEWGFEDNSDPYVTSLMENNDSNDRGLPTPYEVIKTPNYYDDLPQSLRRFTVGDNYDATNPQESLKVGAGAGHHGSHPHLVNEFVRSIIEERKPWIDELLGAQITACGICAHESAMRDGETVYIPRF